MVSGGAGISGQCVTEIFVEPGELKMTGERDVLRTLLGSCVGIAFHAPKYGFAALCHPMMPRGPTRQGGRASERHPTRYVDFAIREVARRLDALGIRRSEVRVKLFGGADVLPSAKRDGKATIGHMNGEAAVQVLHEEGFKIAVVRLGGNSGMQIKFDAGTGEVLVKKLG